MPKRPVAKWLIPLLAAACAHHPPPPSSHHHLSVAATANQQWTGVAVSRSGRLFVNFPRWVDDPQLSVAEILPDGSLHPFPSEAWNQWDGTPATATNRFVCVQSVFVDGSDTLWVLDPASPQMKGVVPGGAKLVRIDLSTNAVDRVYPLPEEIAPQGSYLNDVRIDSSGRHAFITDSGLGALVVLNLESGRGRRLLENSSVTKGEPLELEINGRRFLRDGKPPQIGADGIAIDPAGKWVYLHALIGRTLYRLPMDALLEVSLPDAELASKAEAIAKTPAADGMLADPRGGVILTDIEHGAIVRWTQDGGLEELIRDPQLDWPDSLALDSQGRLYVTASQIDRMPASNDGADKRVRPFKLFRLEGPLFQ